MGIDTNRNGKDSQNSKPERQQAQFGDIKSHNRQGRAVRNAEGTRLSEHEHVRARINIKIQTTNPDTGESPYDAKAYRGGATITIPKDMADIKTGKDLELRDKTYDALEKGGDIPEELKKEMTLEADIERTIESRNQAIENRLKAGEPIDDLTAITDEKIQISAHLQQGGASQRTNDFLNEKPNEKPLRWATDQEIEDALSSLDVHEAAARERFGNKMNTEAPTESNLNRLAIPRPNSNATLASTTDTQATEGLQPAETKVNHSVQDSSQMPASDATNLDRLAMPRPGGTSCSPVTNAPDSSSPLQLAESHNANPAAVPTPASLTTSNLSESSSMSH